MSLWGKNSKHICQVRTNQPKPGRTLCLSHEFLRAFPPSRRAPSPATLLRFFTSEDGELGVDSDLPMRVLSNTFVNVLIPGSPEGLDPQNSTCTFIKFNGLGDRGKETHTHSKCPWVPRQSFIAASKETPDTSTHPLQTLQQLPLSPHTSPARSAWLSTDLEVTELSQPNLARDH